MLPSHILAGCVGLWSVAPFAVAAKSLTSEGPSLLRSDAVLLQTKAGISQDGRRRLHHVLTSDCTANSVWMGHLHAALLDIVHPGQKLSWLVWGCTFQEQKPLFEKVAHKDARVRFFRARSAVHPDTGAPMKDFQASSRPMMIHDWVDHFPEDLGQDEVVVLGEPDQFMMAPLDFKNRPLSHDRKDVDPTLSEDRRSLTDAVMPGRGAAQDAAVGARWYHLRPDELRAACASWDGLKFGNCTRLSEGQASERYGSGPPWALHSTDFKRHSQLWEPLMLRLKSSSQASFESEQSAYGFAAAHLGLDAVLYKHYTVSNPGAGSFEGWARTEDLDAYDPCAERRLPAHGSSAVPLFLHACGTYGTTDVDGTEMRLHKDHVPKDILECRAPLLKHPARDLLRKLKEHGASATDPERANTWMVCSWVNLINTALTKWKGQHCPTGTANLERSFVVEPHADGFRFTNESFQPVWRMAEFYNKGGYGDEAPRELSGTPLLFEYDLEG